MDSMITAHAAPAHSLCRGLVHHVLHNWFRRPRTLLCQEHFSPSFDNEFIWGGGTGIVELLRCGHVRKTLHPFFEGVYLQRALRDIAIEHEAYRRLRHARHILRMVDFSTNSLVLPYMRRGTLKDFLDTNTSSSISIIMRLEWAACLAEAMSELHSHRIIHCDFKPENIMLDDNLSIYVCDFAGSSIDNKTPFVMEDTRFYMPRSVDVATESSDIFALGSTLYQIMLYHPPYPDLSDDEVEERYQKGQFPVLDGIPCGDIIRKCWTQEVATARDVYHALLGELP